MTAMSELGQTHEPRPGRMSCSQFLKFLIIGGGGVLLASCARGEATPTLNPDPSATVPGKIEPSPTFRSIVTENPQYFEYPTHVNEIDFGVDTHVKDQLELLSNAGEIPANMLGHMLAQLTFEKKIQGNDDAALYTDLFKKYTVHLNRSPSLQTWSFVLENKSSGEYLVPLMTEGPEKDQLRRDLMLPLDYVNQPIGTRFFTFLPVKADAIGFDIASHWPLLLDTSAEGQAVDWYNINLRQMVPVGPEATLTPEAQIITIALDKPASEWSAEAKAQFGWVETDPWHATDAQKTEFDKTIVSNWQKMLKDAGVADAENLQNYKLLDAIVEYCRTNKIHEVWLPFAMHQTIRTDKDNLVPYHADVSHNATYGFGHEVSPHPDKAGLEQLASYFTQLGFDFYGKHIQFVDNNLPVMTSYGFSGDLVLRFFMPGIDPDQAQGGLVVMYDQSEEGRYAEMQINYKSSQTKANDVCLPRLGKRESKTCDAGLLIGIPRVHHVQAQWDSRLVSRSLLDYLIDKTKNTLHMDIFIAGAEGDIQALYTDGIPHAGGLLLTTPDAILP